LEREEITSTNPHPNGSGHYILPHFFRVDGVQINGQSWDKSQKSSGGKVLGADVTIGQP
jgi:hypothetical protein